MSAGTLYIAVKGDTKELVTALQQAKNTSVRYGQESKKAFDPVHNSLIAMRNQVLALGSAWLGAQGIQALKQVTDKYTVIDSKLKLVTAGSKEFGTTYSKLYDISQATGTSFSDNALTFANLRLQLKDTGMTTEQTLAMFDGLNKSLVVNGSTTQEAFGFMLQLKQALGSGVLAGEEFRGVVEGNSYWANQLAKALGLDIGQLREMSREQKLTRDVILDAWPKMAAQIDKDFGAIQKTIERSTNELKNAFEQILADGNRASGAGNDISDAISNLAKTVDANRDEIVSVFTGLISAGSEVLGTVGDVGGGIIDLKSTVDDFARSMDVIPASALDWGIIGGVLLRGGPGAAGLAAAMLTINNQLKTFSLNIGSIPEKYNDLKESVEALVTGTTRYYDINTGEITERRVSELRSVQETIQNLRKTMDESNKPWWEFSLLPDPSEEKRRADEINATIEGLRAKERQLAVESLEEIHSKREAFAVEAAAGEAKITEATAKNSEKRVKIKTDEFYTVLQEQKKALRERIEAEEEFSRSQAKLSADILAMNIEHNNQYVDSWQRREELRLEATKNTNSQLDTFTKEFVGFSNAATADIVDAFIRGEDTKVAVAGIASSALSQYAIDSATKGLEPIFTALGQQIGSWIGLGAAEESTEGVGWQQKLANAAKYLAGAGAAVYAGKAIGEAFHADGGWLGANPGGGMINGGSGVRDDVFLGWTDGGMTRNWGMGGEFVVNKEATAKFYPFLKMINSKRFADGGTIADAWGPTRDINESGFDTFWMSALESKGNWYKAVTDTLAYYAGTGGGMLTAKAFGPKVMGYKKGGLIRDRGYLFGGIFDSLLDPFGVQDTINDIMPWVDPIGTALHEEAGGMIDFGTLWRWLRKIPEAKESVERADRILYPFVRDTLTPGANPNWSTTEDMLRQTMKGLEKAIVKASSDMLLGPFSPLTPWLENNIGFLHDGIESVPETGSYILKKGERVTSVEEKGAMSDLLRQMVDLLRGDIHAMGLAIATNTKKAATLLDRMQYEGVTIAEGNA